MPDKNRDRKLRLWLPGPRAGSLEGKSKIAKIPDFLYRKINADSGLLATLDRWFLSTLKSSYHSRERVVEYPFVYRELTIEPPAKILVAGGAGSALAYTLASLGYHTEVLDLRGYNLTHPNLTVTQDDLRNLPQKSNIFDAIICISVIEHVGIDEDNRVPEKPVFNEFARVLRTTGKALVTTPCSATSGRLPNSRVYTPERFKSAIPEGLAIDKKEIFTRSGVNWVDGSFDELKPFDGSSVNSVLCVKLSAEE